MVEIFKALKEVSREPRPGMIRERIVAGIEKDFNLDQLKLAQDIYR